MTAGNTPHYPKNEKSIDQQDWKVYQLTLTIKN